MNATLPAPHPDPYATLRSPSYRLLFAANFLGVFATQMLGVVIGWELYERTHSTLALGLVGLAQVIPVVVLALPAGHVADRFARKWIGVLAMLLIMVSVLGLGALSWRRGPLLLIYVCLFFIGVARAFLGPALQALLAQVATPEDFANAATWYSTSWEASNILGPLAGGLLVAALGATALYPIMAGLMLVVAVLLAALRPRPMPVSAEPLSVESLLAGLRFVWSTKVILAAITLDMFAVLLGGATALLPVYARDILQVGATGLGLLRAAPSVGALTAALVVAHRPPFRHAGRTLLLVVAGFGLGTVVFGLSRSMALSLAMLLLMGALDNVSVVIRHTLVLIRTPDHMRGRVGAVHGMFIGISNELGAFESGALAALIGTAAAVALGGLGTVVVVGIVALAWPEVRRLRSLQSPPPTATDELMAPDPAQS